jgi:hypothetical protein
MTVFFTVPVHFVVLILAIAIKMTYNMPYTPYMARWNTICPIDTGVKIPIVTVIIGSRGVNNVGVLPNLIKIRCTVLCG